MKPAMIDYQELPVIGVVFLICGSYAPGLGHSGIGRSCSDMEYDLMGHNELLIDENLNLDHFNGFGLNELMQTYNASR